MEVHLIPNIKNGHAESHVLWPNKKEYIFYISKLKPESGKRPDVESFINIEKQYALYNNIITDINDDLSEHYIDIALDAYNKKLKEWKSGNLEMKSILIEMNISNSNFISDIENTPGFTQWVQINKVEKIRHYINNIRTF